jgi:hypothetical protein
MTLLSPEPAHGPCRFVSLTQADLRRGIGREHAIVHGLGDELYVLLVESLVLPCNRNAF